EPADVGQPQVDDTAVEAALVESGQGLAAGGRGRDLDVVVVQQVHDHASLDVVVLDHQQSLLVRGHVRLHAIEGTLEVLGGGRLHQVGERTPRQAVLALLLDGQHLDGDVAGGRIELQVVEHRPAQHVGQEHVQGDGGGPVLAGQSEGGLAAVGH